jgi:hypothetical protein
MCASVDTRRILVNMKMNQFLTMLHTWCYTALLPELGRSWCSLSYTFTNFCLTPAYRKIKLLRVVEYNMEIPEQTEV